MNKNEYARSNKEWLAGKAKEDGVTQLAKGVCYKVLQSGPEGGKQPIPNSVVNRTRTMEGYAQKPFAMLSAMDCIRRSRASMLAQAM